MRAKPNRYSSLKEIMAGSLIIFLAALFTFTPYTIASSTTVSKQEGTTTYTKGVPGGVVVNTMDVSARVTAIDTANRKVTLLGPKGNTFTVKVGPEAVNFDQIRVGDLVNATLTEELAVYLYAQGYLSFGKARKLADLTKWEFAERLGSRGIPRHYTENDLEEDLRFATDKL